MAQYYCQCLLTKLKLYVLFIIILQIVLFFTLMNFNKKFQLNQKRQNTYQLYKSNRWETLTTSSKNKNISIVVTKNIVKFAENCLKPRRQFAYIKTHKTGSSTVWRLMIKYIKKHSLLKAPVFPFVGGYPGHVQKDLLFLFTSDHKVRQVIDGEEFVIIDHFRFNHSVLKKSMSNKTVFFSIVRKPWNNFQSAFYYYYYQNPLNFFNFNCFSYPYFHVAQGKIISFPEYFDLAQTRLNESVPWFFRSKNFQSFDLGLNPLLENDDEIKKAVDKLDKELDLMMITEYMDQSMILLKDLLCMEWDDIVFDDDGSTHWYDFMQLENNTTAMKRFNKMYKLDIALYNHFNQTFWNRIQAYGLDRMNDDVEHLRRLRAKTFPKGKLGRVKQPPEFSKETEQTVKTLYNQIKGNNDRNIMGRILIRKIAKEAPLLSPSELGRIVNSMLNNYGGCPA